MLKIQCIYESIEKLCKDFENVNKNKPCVIQIFTSQFNSNDSLIIAKDIQHFFPLAKIVGSSASGVIYNGEQFENSTLICVEQYEILDFDAFLIPFEEFSYDELVDITYNKFEKKDDVSLLRIFMGGTYNYSQEFIANISNLMPKTKITGGISGEIYNSKVIPFVFNSEIAIENAFICIATIGKNSFIYNRVNTSHEPIGKTYTITKVHNQDILEIENQSALNWLQENLGILSTKEYNTAEDVAENDPLVRFQLMLPEYSNASRFVRFNEETEQISQYFSQLKTGTKFKLSYASPSKCVEDCKETCIEIQTKPIEQLYAYVCFFRKMHMQNCAKWELTPYAQNGVCGAFFMGEFGNLQDENELLNGSCVLCGIAEHEKYIHVDFASLEKLENVRRENQDFFNFIIKKQSKSKGIINKFFLEDVVEKESAYKNNLYMDLRFNMQNMLKYETDKDLLEINKICLLKIENAEVLMSYMGQHGYYEQLNRLIDELNIKKSLDYSKKDIKVYAINFDAFILCANDEVCNESFVKCVYELEKHCNAFQEYTKNTPFLIRFVVIFDNDKLLEQAYTQLQKNTNSQSQLLINSNNKMIDTKAEIERMGIIKNAILNNRVVPYYQGIYNNKIGKIDKYEALMRIFDEKGNIYVPNDFMELSKKYRLYLELNEKMLEQVMLDFSKIDCSVNINLSAHDISSEKFREKLFDRLSKFHKPSNLMFEILEDECFSDMEQLKSFIDKVRGFGSKIAIDDFGSGYSNLLEIVKIRPDFIKIDGQIIRGVNESYENEAIIDVTTSLGQKLDIDVVAEYVENKEIQGMIEKYNILHSQGYHFSKPTPFDIIYKLEKDARLV